VLLISGHREFETGHFFPLDHCLTCEDPAIIFRVIFSATKATDTFQEISLGIVHFFTSLKILRYEGLKCESPRKLQSIHSIFTNVLRLIKNATGHYKILKKMIAASG